MSLPTEFPGDVEFSKLVGHHGEIDVTRAALELARDTQPILSFEPTLTAIHEIADSLRSQVTRIRDDVDALHAVCAALADRYGFGGDTACFDRAESSYLNRVIETGRGIPISLSLVYVAVFEELGLPLCGVAAPAHFLCRYEAAAGTLYVDPFRHGRILDPDECVDWISSVSGLPAEAVLPSLEPASPRAVITRMLSNLKALHFRQSNWPAAERVLERLVALRPGVFSERRDLAAVSLMVQRPGRVLQLLKGSQPQLSEEERTSAEELLTAAKKMITAWN